MAAVPMTQLGARAFGHGSNDQVEAEYDRLRDLARSEASKRNACFDKSHQAYERGDGAEAKHLSDEGKRHAAAMDDYNRQASEYIFRENNAPGRIAGDCIDLHGQFVEEAERILEQRIRADQARGQTHLHAIVGKGNHSADHVQKIKPRVEQLCQELGLQYATEENAGRIYINLQGQPVNTPPPMPLPPQQPPYGGQPHGGQQYGGPQQGGQQQQNDEAEQLVEKVLPRLLQKLGDCCVVM